MKWNNRGHEFDEIGASFQKNSDLYIWGTDSVAADLVTRLKALKLPVRIVDESGTWCILGWCGLDVISPAQVLNVPEGKTVLVSAYGQGLEDIFTRLCSAGFQRDKTCFSAIDFRENWLSVYAVYVNDTVYFKDISFIPSTVCNLNCECCLNLTPYLKRMHSEPIDMLKGQIDLFFSKIDYIGLFHVSGGEPILYSHFKELLTYIDEHYRTQIHQLATTTNGTREYPDDVCQMLKEHHVLLISDDYTDALPEYKDFFFSLMARLERNGVWFTKNKVESWIDLAPERTDNSGMTPDELRCFYSACGIPYREYFGGRLYACNCAHYAEKAELCVCDETEYFDFSTMAASQKKELVEFRLGYTEKGYVEFCKRCAGFFNNPYKKQPAVQAPRRYGNPSGAVSGIGVNRSFEQGAGQ